jgi:flagellar basal-body rod modification protein FlgD
MATTSVTSGSIQADYMKLLITQLQNQNPLEPLDSNQMAAQLAQFSQLQQLESMNTSFAKVLSTTEMMYANSLIGKEVSFYGQLEDGTADIISARVESFTRDEDERIVLSAGGYVLGLEDILLIKE